VPSCLGFWVWCVKKPLRILNKNIFGISLVIFTYSSTFMSFYIRCNIVFSTVQFTVPIFSVSIFHGTFEASKKKNCRICHRWTNRGLHEMPKIGPFVKPCILLLIVITVQFSICYWNADVSTPLFRSFFIICATSTELQSKILSCKPTEK
jgi:hypothetical protein